MKRVVVELTQGTSGSVELTQMGSAGYLWALDEADQSVARLFCEQSSEPCSDLIGGFTKLAVRIEAVGAGTTTIRHVRPWDLSQEAGSLVVVVT